MSEPRTDAFANQSFKDREDELDKLYDFARQLERELNAIKEELEEAKRLIIRYENP